MNNDHYRPQTTSVQESQRWRFKEPEKGKILNIRRVVLALKEKYNFPDICEISEETHNEIFTKNTDGL